MSDPIYSFLPWLRSGVANNIKAADGDASIKVRATMPIELTVSGARLAGGSDDRPVQRDVSLYGPGDIVGIDRRAIVKNEPKNWITSFEPNYLPYVEFYDEDFPWRYTPAAADTAAHRLRPWLALIVLEQDTEFSDGADLTGKPLPYIELAAGVSAADVFPDPGELWAWAHVHANTDLGDSGTAMPAPIDALEQTLARDPDLAYSRIMCPRNLVPDTAYHAFLVPTFESGRLAGLGQTVPDSLMATASAWDSGQNQFPYYHRWYFRTGAFGDFEYLVKLLVPRPADKRVGLRDIDVVHPGSGLPPIDTPPELGGVLKLGGALQVPLATLEPADQAEVLAYDQWDQPFPHPFERAIAGLINLADDYASNPPSAANPDGSPDPIVTAPLYGRWHALASRLLEDPGGAPLANRDNWLHRLNLDPRFRVAAGLGTDVVQENDEELMAAAWKQVGDVLSANARMRLLQLALRASTAMHRKHLATLPTARLLAIAAPLHARIMGGATTVAARIGGSVIPKAVTSGVFRRLTRRGATVARKLGLPPGVAAAVLDGINRGRLRPAPPKRPPSGGIAVDDAGESVRPDRAPPWLRRLLARWPWLRYLPFALVVLIALIALLFGPFVALMVILVLRPIALRIDYLLRDWSDRARAEVSISEAGQRPETVRDLPEVANFVLTRPGVELAPRTGPDSPEAVRFKRALADVYTATSVTYARPIKAPIDLTATGLVVRQGVHPRFTLPRRMKSLVFLPPRVAGNMVETFSPCMAYPVFNRPMYKPLSELSAELFLPNINLIPQNSLTLLESNQRFIESYMVGLNHEMGRELLWNEFPTDQRGSYFRQFWDATIALGPNPTDADREALRDIGEIHRWSRSSALGAHDHRGDGALLVLVIRGELLKRYPTAVIYAHKARWPDDPSDPNAEREMVEITPAEENDPPPGKIRMPLFEAKVEPDIYFIGFDLDAVEARGGDSPADDPGWFFAIKERPGEPRFGMDDTTGAVPRMITWNDLSWAREGTASGALIKLDHSLGLDTYNPAIDQENEPDPADAQAQWNPATDAAELAYMLYRVPVLVAVHAHRMLP
jgi:hypothetical protein